MRRPSGIAAVILLTLWAAEAQAYVGPGLGLGVIGVIIGFVVSLLLAVVAVFWYPLKRLFRRISGAGKAESQTSGKKQG